MSRTRHLIIGLFVAALLMVAVVPSVYSAASPRKGVPNEPGAEPDVAFLVPNDVGDGSNGGPSASADSSTRVRRAKDPGARRSATVSPLRPRFSFDRPIHPRAWFVMMLLLGRR